MHKDEPAAVARPVVIPELTTAKFRLRAWRVTDLALIHAASTDAFIPKTTSVPSPYTEEEGERYLERQYGRALRGEAYPFVIAEIDSDRAVGGINVWLRNVDLGRASVAYWVAPSERRRGAAGQALRAVRDWAFRTLDIARLEVSIEPLNVASIRTAEGAGFQREGVLRSFQTVGEERRDMFMYSVLRTDVAGPR
jgi:[ribosomal protein S5]-alanine N-acetyltransferase